MIRKLTGGAETKEGREHLMSSVNISSNSSRFWESEVGTKPNLMWMLPVEGVLARVETRLREIDCRTTQKKMSWGNRKIKDVNRLRCLVDRSQTTFPSRSAYQRTNHQAAKRFRQGIPSTTYLCPTQRVRQRRVYQPEKDRWGNQRWHLWLYT